jgi:hypothetical protein
MSASFSTPKIIFLPPIASDTWWRTRRHIDRYTESATLIEPNLPWKHLLLLELWNNNGDLRNELNKTRGHFEEQFGMRYEIDRKKRHLDRFGKYFHPKYEEDDISEGLRETLTNSLYSRSPSMWRKIVTFYILQSTATETNMSAYQAGWKDLERLRGDLSIRESETILNKYFQWDQDFLLPWGQDKAHFHECPVNDIRERLVRAMPLQDGSIGWIYGDLVMMANHLSKQQLPKFQKWLEEKNILLHGLSSEERKKIKCKL